ncbi:MAG: RNA 2',3'-cyclic phosphodiesterase [Pseudomonadota bacterium]
MPRLFAGLELPPDVVDALRRLRSPIPGARWVDSADFHLTLRFFGDVDARTARDLSDALAQIDQPIFPVSLKGLGIFGSKEPTALWAAVEPNEPLVSLHNATERAARLVGLKPETRNFKPHITLARLRRPRPEAVARFMTHNGGFTAEPFTATRIALFSAKPHTGGGPYAVEDVFPLRGGDWDDDDELVDWSADGDHADSGRGWR